MTMFILGKLKKTKNADGEGVESHSLGRHIENVPAQVNVENDDVIKVTNKTFHGGSGKRETKQEREWKERRMVESREGEGDSPRIEGKKASVEEQRNGTKADGRRGCRH